MANNQPSVFIDGEAGTTGLGIRQRLEMVPEIGLRSLPAARRKDPSARQDMMAACDLVVLCLPDDAAREAAALAGALGADAPKLLDASTAHRVDPEWTYGFPEMARRSARPDRAVAQSRQSRLLPDRRDRLAAPARPSGARPARLPDHDRRGQRLFRRRQIDDRGP